MKKQEKQKTEEHPMDAIRRKALHWQRKNKLANGKTIWGELRNKYGTSGAGKLLWLIDYVTNETAKMIIFSNPKEYKIVDGKRALIVPKEKFKIITQLAGLDTQGMKIRHHETGMYIKFDDVKAIVPNPKGEGLLFMTNTLDFIDYEIEKEAAENKSSKPKGVSK